MNAPAPKPIEDCPNPECKHFCAMYEAPFVSNDGLMHKVKCDDCGYMGPWARTSDEAIRLHNLLCRPNPETQAVAPIELFMCEIPRLTLKPGHPYIFGAAPECPKCAEYLAGSPVESVPVEKIRELEAEWRALAGKLNNEWDYGSVGINRSRELYKCADRLSAIVKENSK